MLPRRRGRPRKITAPLEMIVGGEKQQETLSEGNYLELQKKLEVLENEKKQLQKELEDKSLEGKGLDSESLQRRSIATKGDVAKLQQKIETCKRELSGNREVMEGGNIAAGLTVENRYDKLVDKDAIKIKMLRTQRQLAAAKQIDLTAVEKDRLLERKRELDNNLGKRQSEIGDEWNTKDGYEFAKTVHRLSKYNEECSRLEQELKNINKILNPDDPFAGNLGYLKKRK